MKAKIKGSNARDEKPIEVTDWQENNKVEANDRCTNRKERVKERTRTNRVSFEWCLLLG